MTLGQIAYDAYCKETDGKSLISGAQLPPWRDLDSRIQDAWHSAGLAVRSAIIPDYSLRRIDDSARTD